MFFLCMRCKSNFFLTTWLGIEDTEIKKLIRQRDKASKFIQAFSTCIIMVNEDINYMEFYADITTDLGQIGNNFTSFNSCIVIFINQQWLNNHKDLEQTQLYSLIIESYMNNWKQRYDVGILLSLSITHELCSNNGFTFCCCQSC